MIRFNRLVPAAAVAAVGSCAAVALAGPAAAFEPLLQQYIEVPNCNVPEGTQLCPEIPSVTVTPQKDRIQVRFTANQNHCSDIIAHILIDGRDYASKRVGPGQSNGAPVFAVGTGPHTVGVQAEGITGGCNTTGTLQSWGGTLDIEEIPNGLGVYPVIQVG
jgi:hypothetical protein